MSSTKLDPHQPFVPIGSVPSALHLESRILDTRAVVLTRDVDAQLRALERIAKRRQFVTYSSLVLLLWSIVAAGVVLYSFTFTDPYDEIARWVASVIIVVGLLILSTAMLLAASAENNLKRSIRHLLQDQDALVIEEPSADRLEALDAKLTPEITEIALNQLDTVREKIFSADVESPLATPEELYQAMKEDIAKSVVLSIETAYGVERSYALSQLRDEILPSYTHRDMTTKIVRELGADVEG